MRNAAFITLLVMASWLPFLRGEPPRIETRQESKIEYLGEKTGPTEDELKSSLIPILRKYGDVERAYLAIISTDGRKSWSVALCFAPKKDDPKLVREVGEVFHRMFGRDQFLDMMFLTQQAELDLRKVCPPFYTKGNDA